MIEKYIVSNDQERLQSVLNHFFTVREEVSDKVVNLMKNHITEKNLKILKYILLDIVNNEQIVEAINNNSNLNDLKVFCVKIELSERSEYCTE
ncbi:hypothetical protein MHBO_000830 [Bonamia ostreae]|uniref:Uncharacterized protein n=1 Tax=Bonamia ostreae TaxID=126728 RepID=A0ABV2AH00_9EUKA